MAQINKSSDYFNTVLYTGTNTPQSITGVGFQPDLVWIKPRDNGTWSHNLTDVVRGAGKGIFSDLTTAEFDYGTGIDGSVRTFDSDGFSIGNRNQVNYNGSNIVAWNWLGANGTASNTDGSITSTVSANTTSGFSIVSYTGTGANATVGHGLSSAPKMIIFKNTNSVRDWGVYHGSLSDPDNYLTLNQTYAQTTGFNFSNNTAPTSSVFSVGTLTNNNGSSEEYIAYCFAEKKGFSKFGSYTGNGNADGTFIYTGFKPAWIMIKRTDTAQQWGIMDNKRNTFNPMNAPLFAESSQAESSSAFNNFDILSNGMKMKTGDQWTNGSGGSYIYMAFAENPLVGTNNIPATAR